MYTQIYLEEDALFYTIMIIYLLQHDIREGPSYFTTVMIISPKIIPNLCCITT